MNKKKVLIVVIICLCVLAGGVLAFGNIGNYKKKKKKGLQGAVDSYEADISYLDEERMIPIATTVNFNIGHEKSDKYLLKTYSSGKVNISYNVQIDNGEVSIRVKDNDDIVEEFVIDKAEKNSVEYSLKSNYDYTIEIYIKEGKGLINLDWGEE